MSTDVDVLQPQNSDSPQVDEARWNAWVARGVAGEQRFRLAARKALRLFAIALLVITAAIWSFVAPYELGLRFLLSVSAAFVMFQSLMARRVVMAGVFAGLVCLYNPLAPLMPFAGDPQRAILLTTSLPFIASLVWDAAPARLKLA